MPVHPVKGHEGPEG